MPSSANFGGMLTLLLEGIKKASSISTCCALGEMIQLMNSSASFSLPPMTAPRSWTKRRAFIGNNEFHRIAGDAERENANTAVNADQIFAKLNFLFQLRAGRLQGPDAAFQLGQLGDAFGNLIGVTARKQNQEIQGV